MKKIRNIMILVILFVITVVIFVKFTNKSENILIERSQQTYAWGGFQYSGIIVCNNGEIYEFEFEKDEAENFEEVKTDLSKLNQLILEHKTNKIGDINKDDLKKIKQYSENIKNEYTKLSDTVVMDLGTIGIYEWDYNLNDRRILKDSAGINPTATEIINILKKYDIDVEILEDFEINTNDETNLDVGQ